MRYPARPRFFITALVVCLTLSTLWASTGFSAPMRVIYGFDREFPPFSYEDPGGKPVGFDVELVEAIFAEADVTLVTRPLQWDMIPLELSSGAITLTTGMVQTPQRERLFIFSDRGIFNLQIRLFTKTYKRFPALSMFRGQTVAVEKGSFQHRQLEAFGGINIKTFDSRGAGLQALFYDEVAAFAGAMPNTYYYINKLQYGAITTVGSPLAIVSLRLAVNRSRGDVLRLVNEGLAKVVASGEYDRLYRKWFVRELTREEVDILEKSAITGGVPAYVPYSSVGQGAAVLTATGKIITGCTVENADENLNISAIQGALANAVGQGEFEVVACALVNDKGVLLTPDKNDLQMLHEFNSGTLIVQKDSKGNSVTYMAMEFLRDPIFREVSAPVY